MENILYFRLLLLSHQAYTLNWHGTFKPHNRNHTPAHIAHELRENVRFVLEKWKDIGYSYNHSRTMVSQVSIAEEAAPAASAAATAAPARISQTHRGESGESGMQFEKRKTRTLSTELTNERSYLTLTLRRQPDHRFNAPKFQTSRHSR